MLATAHSLFLAAQAGGVGAVRKDAALAALSSQLAGLQLQAGPGRRASMPEPLGGSTGGQTDPAVVQASRPAPEHSIATVRVAEVQAGCCPAKVHELLCWFGVSIMKVCI
jgi:hypothetical protein